MTQRPETSDLELIDTNKVSDLFKKGKEHTYFQLIEGTGSEMIVNFEEPFKNVVSVEVVHARVPFTEYTIEPDRRDINIEYNGTQHNISMPVKDYSNTDIYETFNSLAESEVPAFPIRMGEEDDTGFFYFYDSTADPALGVAWKILITTTCLIPLGLGQTYMLSELSSSGSQTFDGETYKHVIRCPYRYDLVVSDVLYLNCPELEPHINRGRQSSHIITTFNSLVSRHTLQPLATFIHSSPGIGEQDYRQEIPSRRFHPIASLEKMTLRYSRDSGNVSKPTLPYNFRGIRWCLKIAIKTREIDSYDPEEQESFTQAPQLAQLPQGPGLMRTSNSGHNRVPMPPMPPRGSGHFLPRAYQGF